MTDISKRNKAAKRRGSEWETTLRDYLRSKNLMCERLPKTGVRDEGDLWVLAGKDPRYFVVEAKATRAFTPAEWVEEAATEAVNFAFARGLTGHVPAIVIAKRRNTATGRAYVIQELDDWLKTQGVME